MSKESFNFLKLFEEKKFSLIISIIDKQFPETKKNSGLLNLSGVCKMSLSHSNESLESAIVDFRKSYLKEKTSDNALLALRNFINASVILFDNKYHNDEFEIDKKIFNEILIYYNENKDYFEKNTALGMAIIKVFKRCLDIKNVIYHLEKIIENEITNTDAVCSLGFFNNLKYDWVQEDHLKNAKLLNKRLPKYSPDQLIGLKSTKDKKINLAFLSSDIRLKHSVTYFLRTVLEDTNQDKFNIFLYLNNKNEDETTNEFKRYVYRTRNIINLSNIDAINVIRKDQIDIIIDLNGFSSNHRLALFKNRLAPIQISWCGYINTIGLGEMDYLLADKNLIYQEERSLYSEKIFYLPNIWNCHSGYDFERIKYEAPLISNKYITFGSFNNYTKINDDVIKVWSLILKKVKNSKLILKTSIPTSKSIILEKFEKNGIIKSVEFLSYKKSFREHLNQYKNIDIALDTFPWNGVTTSFESIWMGVPVLTMKGHNSNSRCGESINKNIGLNELIAENNEDYINKAVLIANSQKKLQDIRNKIFENALSSPLFDKKKFANEFFNSLEKIYN